MTLKVGDAKAAAERGGPLIVWREAWALGIPAMDRDHKVLVSLINQIPVAFGAADERIVLTSVLNGLWDYTEFHFAREEAVLAAAAYPRAADHHAKHDALKAQVRGFVEAYAQDPGAVDAEDLLTFMEHWLIDHILVEDRGYVDSVRAVPNAEAAADTIRLVGDDEGDGEPEAVSRLREKGGPG